MAAVDRRLGGGGGGVFAAVLAAKSRPAGPRGNWHSPCGHAGGQRPAASSPRAAQVCSKRSARTSNTICGSFRKLGVRFLGVLIIRILLYYNKVPYFPKLPCGGPSRIAPTKLRNSLAITGKQPKLSSPYLEGIAAAHPKLHP